VGDVIADLKATLTVDSGRFRAGLGQAHQQLLGFSNSISRVSSLASAALASIAVGGLAAGTAAIGAGLFKSVQGASNLTETLGKVGETFGGSAGVVTAAADDMAARYGTVKASFLDAASGIGLIAQGVGVAKDASAGLGVELAKLGDDAASFFNVSFEESLQKISSGLVGESEPLRKFGVVLNEAAVQQEALRLGLAKTSKEISEQAKILARASLIKKGLATASGDRERTKDSPANRQREIGGRTTNALTDLGQAVTPIWAELLNQVNAVGSALGGFVTRNKGEIASWAQGVVADIRGIIAGARDLGASFQEFLGSKSGALIREGVGGTFTWLRDTVTSVVGGIGDALDTAGIAMRNWDSISEIAGLQINQTFQDVGTTVEWLGTVFGSFLDWFGTNWQSIFADALTVTLSLFQSFGDVLKGQFEQIKGFLSDPLHFEIDWSKFNPVETFKKVVDDLSKVELKTPPLEIPKLVLDHSESDRQIADITGEIGRREGERAAAKSREGKVAPADAAKGKAKEADSAAPIAAAAKPQFQDLQSFAKSLQLGALGGKGPAERTAKATEDAHKELKEIKAALKQQRPGGPVLAVAGPP
jgi:hypothetical protein